MRAIMEERQERQRIKEWLRGLMEDRELTGTTLAHRAGLAQSTINRFLNDENFEYTLSTRTISKICNALGAADPFEGLDSSKHTVRMVPVISWIQAGEMRHAEDPYMVGDAERRVAVTSNRSTLVANTVRGTSINRRADDGDIIVWDYEDRDLVDGKFYVIKIDGNATVKRYRRNPERFEPYSLDPDHPTIFATPQLEVLGRVLHAVRDL